MSGRFVRTMAACGALAFSAICASGQAGGGVQEAGAGGGRLPRAEPAAAQKPPAPAQDRQPQTDADETFVLDIDVRRITESNFEASTEVEAGEESGLNVRVGVMVGAGRIDVLLRNVRGSVRFRATLDPVLRLLNSRRAPAPPGTPPAP